MQYHGIMFHHFFDTNHVKGQGAISADELDSILIYYKESYNILLAHEYLTRAKNNTLTNKDVCLTFDDSLKCQFDIALPVLKRHGLTAFWFVYTNPLVGNPEKLEIYRHFRTVCFKDIDDFYESFFDFVKTEFPDTEQSVANFDPDEYLKGFSFYSKNDKIFRFLRDNVLGIDKYNHIMDRMLKLYNYSIEDKLKLLWIDKKELIQLHNEGHIIGLHSHTHPTALCKQSKEQQKWEYATNKEKLEEIINSKIISASYPCNSYDNVTLNIMEELGIEVGFRANMQNGYSTVLDICREDHANIIKIMKDKRR